MTMADLQPDTPTNGGPRGKRITKIDQYTDEHGTLLFEVVRFEPKGFRQRRPDGDGGYLWKLDGVRRVLFRLPAVLAAVAAGRDDLHRGGRKGR